MTNLWAFLAAASWPLVRKVLVMMGIGVLTYSALTTLVNSIVSNAQSNWGQLTGAALQLSSLGGIPQVLGIITGALVARVTFIAVGKIGVITK